MEDQKASEFKCRICGYVWTSRVDVPKQCPRCKRYDYEEPRKPAEVA